MVIVRAKWLNRSNGLFVVGMLQNEQYKYSYGRAFLIDRIQETMMKLPIQHNPDGTPYIDCNCIYSEDGYVPDWQFMEDYMKALPYGDRLQLYKVSDFIFERLYVILYIENYIKKFMSENSKEGTLQRLDKTF